MRATRDRVTVAVLIVTFLAVSGRVLWLGDRPFHWDEARTGYWALRSAETGSFEYRPVAGGPLVAHLARSVLRLGTATDFLARLPVAVLTGLLPAVALVFRDRLRDDETVALALLLGFTPLVFYYGRFLRGDVLAAGAALAAVGFAARWVRTDRDRWLYAAAAAVAVALSASAFAVATGVLVLAAAVLTFDHRRVLGTNPDPSALVDGGVTWLRTRATPLARATFAFLGVWGVLFAPRGYGVAGDPIGFLLATYREPVRSFLAVRVAGREGTEFLPFVTDAAGTLPATSTVALALGIVGFLADRYGSLPAIAEPRPLVAFTGFWAALGLIGYPVVAEVQAPWTLVHALVPLSLPGAVTLAGIYRYGRRAVARNDAARAATALLVLAAVVAGAGIVALDGVHGPNDPSNDLAHYGQPASDLEPLWTDRAAGALIAGDGRVVYVGERYDLADEEAVARPPIADASDREAFGERLPLPWYVERTDATVESVSDPADIEGVPAVLIVSPEHETAVTDRFPDHEAETVELALWNREAAVVYEAS